MNSDRSAMAVLHDALDDAIADAYAGGSRGDGWMFMGEPISKEEMKVRIIEDPDKMRHLARMQSAAWAIVESHVASDEERREPVCPECWATLIGPHDSDKWCPHCDAPREKDQQP